jgi:hypothetical protein
MADQRVTELVAVVTPAVTDLFAVRQAGDTRDKKETIAQLLSLIPPATAFPEFQFGPLILENPNNAGWAVNALAPAVADNIGAQADLIVRLFDDTVEEGVGFGFVVPATAANVKFTFQSRAISPAGADRTIGLKLYARSVPDNVGVTAWNAGVQLTDVTVPNNTNFQTDTQTLTLAAAGLVAGTYNHLELTRVNPTGGTELVGDWALLLVKVEFT